MNVEELLSHSDFLRDLARSLVLDEHAAADVEQETWLATLSHPPPSEKPFRSWLARVARNFARKQQRGESRRWRREGAAAVPDRVPPASKIAEREEIRRKVIEAVLALQEPYRSTLILRYYESLPPREVARHFDIPTETVRTRIKRGLDQLRAALDTEHGGDRKRWLLAVAPLAGVKLPSAGAAVGVIAMTTKMKVGIGIAAVVAVGIALTLLLREEEEKGSSDDRSAAIETPGHVDSNDEAIQTDDPGEVLDKKTALASDRLAVEIYGTVCSRDSGDGLANARVEINPLPHREDKVASEAVADGTGRFSMLVPRPEDQDPTSYHIRIRAEGFLDLETTLPGATDKSALDCGSYFMIRNSVYPITIRDEKGSPLPGARVTILKYMSKSFRLEKTADEHGRIEVTDRDFQWGDLWMNIVALRVKAQGMSDCFLEINNKDIPSEICMAPAAIWSCVVADAETGEAVENAVVSMDFGSYFYFTDNPFEDHPVVKTDENGYFEYPSFTAQDFLLKRALAVSVIVEGYLEKRVHFDLVKQLPHVIKMTRVTGHEITCLVVNSITGEPLPGLPIEVKNEKKITDEEGCFRLALEVKPKEPPHIFAHGYKQTRDEYRRSSTNVHEPYVIRLRPVLQDRQQIKVIDELGRPVADVNVRIKYRVGEMTYTQNRYTDQHGVCTLHIASYQETETVVSLEKPGYARFISKPFPIGKNHDALRTFMIERGILYQNLKVVDERGEPRSGAEVSALLILENGERVTLKGHSDSLGKCDLVFMPFAEGILEVMGQPETCIEISYDDIRNRKEIVLGYLQPQPSPVTIRVSVKDEMDRPLENILVSQAISGNPQYIRQERSNAQGFAVFPAFRSSNYQFTIHSTRIGEQWFRYIPKVREGITAGMEVEAVMGFSNGVSVSLAQLYIHAVYPYATLENAGVRLETAENVPVSVRSFRKEEPGHYLFYGVPAGMMRVVVIFPDGERLEGDLFELEEGKCLHVEFDEGIPR